MVDGTARAGARRNRRRGISLIEILVVLALLVLGIFAIARIFPEGFLSIGYSANVTLAGSLSRHRIDEFRRRAENMPDGIVSIDPVTGLIRPNVTPGDLLGERPYTDNPIAGNPNPLPDDPRHSGVNINRRVMGESFMLPPPTVGFRRPDGNVELVSLYRALLTPIYSAVPLQGSSLGVSAYAATPLQRVIFSDPPTAENWSDLASFGPFAYGINYERALLYFLSTDYVRQFRVEFTYHSTPDARGQTVPENCIELPADTMAPRQVVYDMRVGQTVGACVFTPMPAGAELDRGSDFMFRRFRQLGPNVNFSGTDPYEFKVYDTVFGLFGFNPIGASLPLTHSDGRGLSAKLDYDVDDWHILRVDEQVPLVPIDTAASPNSRFSLKVPAAPIKKVGKVEETMNFLSAGPGAVDTTFEYQGLIRSYPATALAAARPGTPGIDVVVVDIQTGLQIDSRTLQRAGPDQPVGTDASNGEIDYASGIIHLREVVNFSQPGGGAPLVSLATAGRNLRIYYRGHDDFAVASFKPFFRYYRQPDLTRLEHRQFYTDYGYGYVLFPSGDAEKTVAVDYRWQDSFTGQMRTEVGELHQLKPPDSFNSPTAGSTGRGAFVPDGRWWVRVDHADRDPTKDPDTDPTNGSDLGAEMGDGSPRPYRVVPNGVQILGVRGASFHTRVLWREGRRWRYRERATILTRESPR